MDERFTEWQVDLPTEDVEIVGGCSAVGDDPVDVVQLTDSKVFALRGEVVRIVRGHLQETFKTSARMFRSL